MNTIKRYGLITLGILALSVGAIGIVVSLLPTTPLVLLAALCFASSSERMYTWLARSKYFGDYITNYKNGTGVPRNSKIAGIAFLWIVLLISAFFMRDNTLILVILAIVGVCVTAHILLLKGQKTAS